MVERPRQISSDMKEVQRSGLTIPGHFLSELSMKVPHYRLSTHRDYLRRRPQRSESRDRTSSESR